MYFGLTNVNFKQVEIDWDFIIDELESNDNLILSNYLKSLPKLICSLKDDKGLNILHHCVLKGVVGKTKFLVDYAKKTQLIPESNVVDWIN
jgi:hypothetical protein